MAISGVSGIVYATKLVDLSTGNEVAVKDLVESSTGGEAATWATLSGKPAVIAAGATQAEARTAIGAGTSSLSIGTTAATAMAGNKVPTATQRGGVLLQNAIADLAADADAAAIASKVNAILAALRSSSVITA